MTIRVFEDPAKTRLKRRLTDAIEASGMELITPSVKIALPIEMGLRGGIVPDVQAMGQDGYTINCFVRPGSPGSKPIPEWLGTLARGSHELDRILVYLAVENSGEKLERSCRDVGAGLFLFGEGVQLLNLIDPRQADPTQVTMALTVRLRALRRKLENRLELNLNEIQTRFDEIRGILSPEAADPHLIQVEAESLRWRTWGDHVSERIDSVSASGRQEEISAIESEIEAGPS